MLTVAGFIGVKIIHELGHGLACYHTGHECTEMGLIFLVFLPCMYCEVSDIVDRKQSVETHSGFIGRRTYRIVDLGCLFLGVVPVRCGTCIGVVLQHHDHYVSQHDPCQR